MNTVALTAALSAVVASRTLGAGAIGFLVVIVLVAGSAFLFRSMTRHLRKVPKSFDEPADPPPPGPDDRAG
jgi:galactokinase/mevalonate kinase-like predicted kinase